ncbi:histidine kinase [Streptomyces abyssalis]|uniref:histidine kinase n=1 Tax=Streptomyces abyssalis TaxID=933944 RepID=A0A1E7JKJ5_9ACTN|nr:histidine kinase [Streptomyces abyssalis]OEU88167.1 histidine kinase [Streptomyces abyssalis]OEU91038.1 histidine kinase [Streptomyces abyssalis]OEV26544.1 histidine kinase [Streptomyces nanshensis]
MTPRPSAGEGTAGPALRKRVQASLLAAARGLALCLLSLGVSLALFIASVLSIVFIVLGVGLFTTPAVTHLVRMHANQRRRLAHDWTGITVPPPYRPLPPAVGAGGTVRRCMRLLRDPATWRDLIWLLTDAVFGFVTALFPAALVGYGIEGFVIFAGVWRAVQHNYWYAFIPVEGFGTATLCAGLGALLIVLATSVNPYFIKGHFLIVKGMISPSRGAQLEQRVERLYETRHDAVDSSAAELRRIERDLHDGAQARLVSMGMSLGTIEALIEKDPAQAKKLIAQARENSAEALTELRDLVRGIHPPVLAERGLGDAARALALRMQVPVETDVELDGRFAEPVESAAYFAISEVLTNAAKHARAERVWLDVHFAEAAAVDGRGQGMLRIAVTDNGRGGADLGKGSGMAGIERRLGQLDGILAVSSPPGGPTMVTMEIPCEILRRR